VSFFREFVRDPLTVGTVAPSAPALARATTTAAAVYVFLLPPVKRLRTG
jgi:phospholipid N-methyltransferase